MINSRTSFFNIKITRWVLAIVVVGVLGLTGCGSSSYDESSEVDYGDNMSNQEDGALTSSVETEAYDKENSEDNNTSTEAVDTSRKLITTMDIYGETEEFDEMYTSINEKIVSLGGYVESSNLNNYNDGDRSINMKVRIPEEKLNQFVDQVDKEANIRNKVENVQDVTLTYVDLKSHVTVLEAEEARLLELLEKAESIEDILAIEDRISNVRYQRESMASQLQVYDNQIKYSTVNLNIDEVERTTPKEQKSWTGKVATGFSENLYRVGHGLTNFFTSFVIALPIIILWLVGLGIVIIILKAIIKPSPRRQEKRRIKAKKKAEKKELGKGDKVAKENLKNVHDSTDTPKN